MAPALGAAGAIEGGDAHEGDDLVPVEVSSSVSSASKVWEATRPLPGMLLSQAPRARSAGMACTAAGLGGAAARPRAWRGAGGAG